MTKAAGLAPIQIERIQEWQLTAADDRAIAALLARCFPTDFGGRSYFVQPHHMRLVVRHDGQIIGHMALLLRAVDLDGRRLIIGGLGDVATDPAHRGKGIAAALLHEAIAMARSSPAIFLLLFGVAKIYASAGCQAHANPLVHLVWDNGQTRQVMSQGSEDLMVLPLRDEPWLAHAFLDLRGALF